MRKRTPHRMNGDDEEKFCPLCNDGEGEWHPIASFNRKLASWDNLETKCKHCTKKKSKKYRADNPHYDKEYQEKNRDALKAYKREYYYRKASKKNVNGTTSATSTVDNSTK